MIDATDINDWITKRIGSDDSTTQDPPNGESTLTSGQQAAGDGASTGLGDIPINRRTWIKTMGACIAAPAVASQAAKADSPGYGEGEYATRGFGDSSDASDPEDDPEAILTVETGEATDVAEASVTLNGEVTELVEYTEATVSIEWGEPNTGFPNTTTAVTISESGVFEDQLTGLDPGTDYEFRAVAAAGDETDTGQTRTFATEETDDGSPGEVEPVITSFDVNITTREPTPHLDVAVDWSTEIEEGELEMARLILSDDEGVLWGWQYHLEGTQSEQSEEMMMRKRSWCGCENSTYKVSLTVDSDHDTSVSEKTLLDLE